MRRNIRTVLCLAVAAMCIVTQTGCRGKEPVSGSDFLLNTACSITIYRDERGQQERQELIQDAFDLCREYENRLSRTVVDSDIGRINRAAGAAVLVDSSTARVIEEGLRYAGISHGLFDITVGELAELWNFSGDDPRVPPAEAVAEAVKHVGYEKVKVLSGAAIGSNGTQIKTAGDGEAAVQLSDPETKLDLGGIAKGYIADRAAEFLRDRGVKSAILNFGGNIVCVGEKEEGVPFVIGVEKPFSAEGGQEKEILGTVRVSDMAVVTSGTYERKFYEDGVLYYHILDPATGYPRETDLDGVSILGPNSTDCDGLSTTCLMLGLEKGKELVEAADGFEAAFVTKDGRIVTTEGFLMEEAK